MEPDLPTRSSTSLHTCDILDNLLYWELLEPERHQSELPDSNPGALQDAHARRVGEGVVEAPQEATLASSHCTEPAKELVQRRPKGLPRATRRQKQNRQAQHRLRQRQKAQAQDLEVQACQAVSHLHQLQARQLQLTARNSLLETVINSNFDFDPDERIESWCPLLNAEHTVSLTALNSQAQVKTVQDIGNMPFTKFSTLYAAFAHKLSRSLISQRQASDVSVWIEGLNRLRVCLAVGNAGNFIAFTACRLDGSVGPGAKQLSDAWYHDFMAGLRLTEDQQEQMMHIRVLFYGKLGALRRHRKKLLQQVPAEPSEAGTSCEASSRLAAVVSSAQQLEHNSSAELRAHLLVSAYLRLSTDHGGILTAQQQALSVITAFPYSPEKLRMMEVLAARRKEPPGGVLAHPGDLDDFGHHGNWQQLVNNVKAVTRANLHVRLPLSVY